MESVSRRLSTEQFAEEFGFKRHTAYNLCRVRSFPCVKIGNKNYIDADRAREWLKNQESKGVKFQWTYLIL